MVVRGACRAGGRRVCLGGEPCAHNILVWSQPRRDGKFVAWAAQSSSGKPAPAAGKGFAPNPPIPITSPTAERAGAVPGQQLRGLAVVLGPVCRVRGSLPRSACPQQNPPVGKGGSVNPSAESGTGAQLLIYCRSPREVRKELLVAFFFFFPFISP